MAAGRLGNGPHEGPKACKRGSIPLTRRQIQEMVNDVCLQQGKVEAPDGKV